MEMEGESGDEEEREGFGEEENACIDAKNETDRKEEENDG